MPSPLPRMRPPTIPAPPKPVLREEERWARDVCAERRCIAGAPVEDRGAEHRDDILALHDAVAVSIEIQHPAPAAHMTVEKEPRREGRRVDSCMADLVGHDCIGEALLGEIVRQGVGTLTKADDDDVVGLAPLQPGYRGAVRQVPLVVAAVTRGEIRRAPATPLCLRRRPCQR